jgi:hypothetical protein
MPLVELQNTLNDLVIDSSHLGRARSTPTPFDSPRGSRLSKKRLVENPKVEGTKRLHRGEGYGFGRDVAVDASVEAVTDLFQALAGLILTPLLGLWPLMSVNDTKRRDYASSAIRRDTVSSNTRF